MDIRKQKEKLRQQLLEQRQNISEDDYRTFSDVIIKKLLQQSEFEDANSVHCYISMNNRGEVDTHGLIKKMIDSEKEVNVPITNFGDRTLTHIRLTSYEVLEENKWGVMEPNDGKKVSPDEFDLVIVPMVGADEECNRIGYGKGFYDRFLEQVDCPKIGLIFERNVVPHLPVEEYDVPLDKVVTERRVIKRD